MFRFNRLNKCRENDSVALNAPWSSHSKKRRRILSWGIIWCQSEVNMQTKPYENWKHLNKGNKQWMTWIRNCVSLFFANNWAGQEMANETIYRDEPRTLGRTLVFSLRASSLVPHPQERLLAGYLVLSIGQTTYLTVTIQALYKALSGFQEISRQLLMKKTLPEFPVSTRHDEDSTDVKLNRSCTCSLFLFFFITDI